MKEEMLLLLITPVIAPNPSHESGFGVNTPEMINPDREAIAYELNPLVGLGQVPVTVVREIEFPKRDPGYRILNTIKGILQDFDLEVQGPENKDQFLEAWKDGKRKIRIFDYL